MTDANRRKELEALAASFQQPGRAVPVEELTEYLRLVSLQVSFSLANLQNITLWFKHLLPCCSYVSLGYVSQKV